MLFNGKDELDKKRAVEKIKYFFEKGKTFEIIEKRDIRSPNQNRYLHLILSWFALEYGETVNYVKEDIFKQHVNQDIFLTEYANRKTGEIRTSWRSTAELDTKEMTVAIDRFRHFASKEAGIYLPEPKDLPLLQQIHNEVEKNKQFL